MGVPTLPAQTRVEGSHPARTPPGPGASRSRQQTLAPVTPQRTPFRVRVAAFGSLGGVETVPSARDSKLLNACTCGDAQHLVGGPQGARASILGLQHQE